MKQETAKGGMTGLQSGNIYWKDYTWKCVCSLNREVKVKVTKFCVGLEELINAYKLTK